jgi:hypothetical protein
VRDATAFRIEASKTADFGFSLRPPQIIGGRL